MVEPVEDVLDLRGAVRDGMDLLCTVVCKPDWRRGQLGYARFIIPMRVLADPDEFNLACAAELEVAADDIRRFLDQEGYKITSTSLWRSWSVFVFPHDLKMQDIAAWDGD